MLARGYMFRTFSATGFCIAGGILLPGMGTPPAAKLINGVPISEKSPVRCTSLGTVAVVVYPCLLRKPS
jgi:hypothetical protein